MPDKKNNEINIKGEKPIKIGIDFAEKYIPMDDYKALDYKPMLGRDCHFCRKCVDYYKDIYDKGFTSDPFVPSCQGDYRLLAKKMKDQGLSDEEFQNYKMLQDPVAWAKFEFDWEARWYQQEVMRCSSQFKAIRAGRRVGKTEAMSVLALWQLFTNGGVTDRQFEVLILAPYQPQVAKIFDTMRDFIGRSSTLNMPGMIKRNVLNPQMIEFSSGGVARGWSSGAHSGAKSDKVRGQDADLIILDEVDYINDSDIEVIMAIMASHPTCQLIVSSTPTGIRKKLYNWCCDKTQGFKEFWFISAESPSWTKKVDHMFKQNYSKTGYQREFLAEFGDEAEGVFRSEDVNACLADYVYEDCIPHTESKYVIGVDWGKTTGTHIIVTEAMNLDNRLIYKTVDKHIIRTQEFQQIEAIKKIMELDKVWGNQTAYIYVDAGYGHVQVEMMWKYDMDYPNEHTNYKERVKPITMNSNIEITDPVSGMPIKKPVKQFMVDAACRTMEMKQVLMPADEDTTTRIVPSEIPFANIGIVQQMRAFKIVKYSPSGVPTYSQDYEHTLTAWMLCIMGHILEFSDIKKIEHVMDIAYSLGAGSDNDKDSPFPELNNLTERQIDLEEAKKFSKKIQKDLTPQKRTDEDKEVLIDGNDIGVYISRRQSTNRARGDSVRSRTRYHGNTPRGNRFGRGNI